MAWLTSAEKPWTVIAMLSRAIVLSDIHLGPGGPLTVFRDGAALNLFLRKLASDQLSTELILAGDVFDFLQCSDYVGFDPEKAPERFRSIVKHNQAVFEALAAFADHPQHEITILSGNHDPEVLLPAVRTEFEKAVKRRGTVKYEELLTGGDDERYSIWGRSLWDNSVWVVHGDRWDTFNAIHRDALLGRSTQKFVLPPGSHLVFEVLSKLQDGGSMPWVYELKPELETVLPLLWYLAPVATKSYLRQHFGLMAGLLKNYVQAALLRGPTLGVPQVPAPLEDLGQILGAILAEDLREMKPHDAEVLLAQLEDWTPKSTPAVPTLAVHDGVRRWLLRAWLRAVRKNNRFLATDGHDGLPTQSQTYWPNALRVLVAGHTHAPRQRSHQRPMYVNAGTWLPIGRLPEGDMKQVIDDIEAGKPWPVTVPRSFVVIDREGRNARLGFCDENGVDSSGVL